MGVLWALGQGWSAQCEACGAEVECRGLSGAEPCDKGLEVCASCEGSEGDPQKSPQVHR